MSAATGMVNAYGQSRAQAEQGKYAQQQANLNASGAALQGEAALANADREAQTQALRTRKALGAQRAALAAQGVDVNRGSALAGQEETAAMGAVDAETIRRNGIMESLGFQMQSASDVGQGRMARLASRNAASQTLLAGGLQAAREIGQGAYYADKLKTPAPKGVWSDPSKIYG